jgi:thiol-disulfide isomerase/thioredoxin
LNKQWIPLAIVLVIVSIIVYQNISRRSDALAQQAEELPKVGFKAPNFSLQSLDGKTYEMPTPNNKPVVVNFWASWCGPCRLEAPELVKIYKKYQGNIEIYAVNLTSQDSPKEAKAFADSFGFTFPILLDNNKNFQVSDLYQVQAIPTTYFIDKNGMIIDKIAGYTDPQTLEKKFRDLQK